MTDAPDPTPTDATPTTPPSVYFSLIGEIHPSRKFHALPLDYGPGSVELAAAMNHAAYSTPGSDAVWFENDEGTQVVRLGRVVKVYWSRGELLVDAYFDQIKEPKSSLLLGALLRLEPVFQLDVLRGPERKPGPVEGRLLRGFNLFHAPAAVE